MNPATTVALWAVAASVLIAASPVAQQGTRPTTMAGRSAVYAPNAAIATSQPLATSA